MTRMKTHNLPPSIMRTFNVLEDDEFWHITSENEKILAGTCSLSTATTMAGAAIDVFSANTLQCVMDELRIDELDIILPSKALAD